MSVQIRISGKDLMELKERQGVKWKELESQTKTSRSRECVRVAGYTGEHGETISGAVRAPC